MPRIVHSGWLYFTANDGRHGSELWRTDGVRIERVSEIDPGSPSSPLEIVSLGSELYFTVNQGSGDIELWRTDGTLAGTRPVGEINDTGSAAPRDLTVLNGRLYFAATDGRSGQRLWSTDGSGPRVVEGTDPGSVPLDPRYLTVLGDWLYFNAGLPGIGGELWRTDGETFELVADINRVGSSDPVDLTPHQGALYFRADDGIHGRELWRTTGRGAELVADISPGADSGEPEALTSFGGHLYLIAREPEHGRELWRTMGAGAELVADILEGEDPAFVVSDPRLVVIGNRLWFRATDGIHGHEVWTVEERPMAEPPLPAPPPFVEPPLPVDRSVTASLLGRQVKLNRSGVGFVQVRCPASEANGPCRGDVVLRTQARFRVRGARRARQVVLARARFSVAAGKTARVRLRLSAAARRLLASTPRARNVRAVAMVRDAVGNRARVTKGLRVVAPRVGKGGGARKQAAARSGGRAR